MTKNTLNSDPKELKAILILGPNFYVSKNILKLYDRPDCRIIHSDKEDIFDIANILKKENLYIGGKTRIDINTHATGSRNEQTQQLLLNKDFVDTAQVFETLQKAGNGTPLYVHLWSCYAQIASYNDVKNLGENSILVTHSGTENSSSRKLASYTFEETIKNHFTNNKLTHKQQFIDDLPYNFETPTFSQVQSDGSVKTFVAKNSLSEKNLNDLIYLYKDSGNITNIVNRELEENKKEFYKIFPQKTSNDKTSFNLSKNEVQDNFMGQLTYVTNNEKFQNENPENIKEFISLLRDKGLDFNHRIPLPHILFYSIKKSPELFIPLIKNGGVDKNIQNIKGETPLLYVLKNTKYVKIIEAYLEDKSAIQPDLTDELLLFFIKRGSNLERLNYAGFTTENFLELLDTNKSEAELYISNGHNIESLHDLGLTVTELRDMPFEQAEVFIKNGFDIRQLHKIGLTVTELRDMPFEQAEVFIKNGSNLRQLHKIGLTVTELRDMPFENSKLIVENGDIISKFITNKTFIPTEIQSLNIDQLKYIIQNHDKVPINEIKQIQQELRTNDFNIPNTNRTNVITQINGRLSR